MAGITQNVAVIGAGVSGVVSALHLEAAGLKVTVYERSSAAGGVWCVRPELFPSSTANLRVHMDSFSGYTIADIRQSQNIQMSIHPWPILQWTRIPNSTSFKKR